MGAGAPARLAARVVLSALAAVAAVLLAAVGVTAASASVDASRPAGGLELVAADSLDSTDQVPGAVVERVLTLHNSGTATYAVIELGSTASGHATGLRLQVVGCETGWRPARSGPVCGGGETVLAAGAVGGTTTLTNAAALRPGGTDSLLVRLTLPDRAGVTARVTYTAVGR